MHMSYQVRDCDGGLGNCIEVKGRLLGREYIEFLVGHLGRDPEEFARYRYSFVDFTGVTESDLSNEEIKTVADMCKQAATINPDPVIAITTNDDLTFGLTRMYEAMVNETDWEIQVFRTRPEAIVWLARRVKEKFGIEDLKFE